MHAKRYGVWGNLWRTSIPLKESISTSRLFVLWKLKLSPAARVIWVLLKIFIFYLYGKLDSSLYINGLKIHSLVWSQQWHHLKPYNKCQITLSLFYVLTEVGMDSKLTKSIAKDVRKRVRSARTPAPDVWPVTWPRDLICYCNWVYWSLLSLIWHHLILHVVWCQT